MSLTPPPTPIEVVRDYSADGWERRGTVPKEFAEPLGLEELMRLSNDLVEKLDSLDALGTAMSAARARYKTERDAVQEAVQNLRAELRDRKRKVKRDCAVWMNFSANVVHIIDSATHTVVEERAITAEERQQVLAPVERVDGSQAGQDVDDDSEDGRVIRVGRRGPGAALPPEPTGEPKPRRGPQRRRV